MKPSQVSEALRRIASKIDRSTSPDRNLVVAAIGGVLSSMPDPEIPAGRSYRSAGGEGMVTIKLDGLMQNMKETKSPDRWEKDIGQLVDGLAANGWEVVSQEDEDIVLNTDDEEAVFAFCKEVAEDPVNVSFNPDYTGVSLVVNGRPTMTSTLTDD